MTTRRIVRSAHGASRRRSIVPWIITGVAVIALGVGVAVVAPTLFPSEAAENPGSTDPATTDSSAPSEAAASESTATPTAPPLSPAQQLLADAKDPSLCAIVFTGTPTPIDPILAPADHRLTSIPIPTSEGQAFAGWYTSPEAAAAQDISARVNESRVASCDPGTREETLTAAWVPLEVGQTQTTGVPILMYHQFTQLPEGEDSWLKGNFVYVPTFAEHMQYLVDQGYYLPSWPELKAFIDGTLILPEKSVIITDDDADPTWIEWAAPIVAEDHLLTTSFVITSARQDPTPNEWVIQRSHTHDMHSAGANGKGKMVNYTIDEMVADLTQSAQILGATEVIAYPFGHYNDDSEQAVAQAGYTFAVTTEPGFVQVGSNPLALPRQRVSFGMTVDDLAATLGD